MLNINFSVIHDKTKLVVNPCMGGHNLNYAYSLFNFIFQKMMETTYLNQEEMNSECIQAPGKLNVLVFSIYLWDTDQGAVLSEYPLLNVLSLHEGQGKKFFQTKKK